MGMKLPQNVLKLIEDKNFAHLATLLHDGAPHVAPVWVDHDGNTILVNTAIGRVKQKNILKDPRVALSIAEQNNPYNRVEIRGRVISQTRDGADAHIDKLANKYTGTKTYQKSSPNEKRIIIKIEPLHISS